MKWKKLGLVYRPEGNIEWMNTHCQLPVADHLYNDIYRVFFASRSKEQISHIGFVDLDINQPDKVIRVSTEPVVKPGSIGHFDHFGVYPSSIVNYKEKKYLYYIGWIRGFTPPLFYASIGLAISEDGGNSFYKYSIVPIMERSKYDPCLVTSPNVFIDDDGTWRMTYVSGEKWEIIDGKLKSFYNIKYAESMDGISWKRDGKVAIDFKNKRERNIARSAVFKEEGIYKMYFSYAEGELSYRIGYAESLDCINWKRMDDLSGITVSDNSFDSEMICYPNVILHQGKRYMFYNGNEYGKTGFGLAILENKNFE